MSARKILTFEEAEKILSPYVQEYLECVRSGFLDYVAINEFKNSLNDYGDFAIRTRAGIIHDRIRAKLTAKFGAKPTIEVGEWKQVFALKFSNDIFMRIKKFSKDGRVSSFRTPQHVKYLNQRIIEGFPDEPTFVIGGYIPNLTWTDLVGVYLACYTPDGLEWFNKVGDYVVEQAKIIFPETGSTLTRRTKPKSKPGPDEKKGIGND